MTAFRHLLDRCDLELLCIPLSTYIFSLTRNYGSGVSTIVVAIQRAYPVYTVIAEKYEAIRQPRHGEYAHERLL